MAVKRGLTQRLRERVGMGDSDSSDEETSENSAEEATLKEYASSEKEDLTDGVLNLVNKKRKALRGRVKGGRSRSTPQDIEMGRIGGENEGGLQHEEGKKSGHRVGFQKAAASMASMSMLEQSMPADAVLAKEGAKEVCSLIRCSVLRLTIV